MDTIKNDFILQTINYLKDNGITVSYNDLNNNIKITRQPKKTIRIKPKTKETNNERIETKETRETNNQIKPKLKLKLKVKVKNKQKKSDYDIFVDICLKNNIFYFQYYDTHNWSGPCIKTGTNNVEYYKALFKQLETTIIPGTNFFLIRPSCYLDDENIHYNKDTSSLQLHKKSLVEPSSDAESDNEVESDAESDAESDNDAEEWTYDGITYLVDSKKNIYSKQSNDFIGIKIDDFTIDYESKER